MKKLFLSLSILALLLVTAITFMNNNNLNNSKTLGKVNIVDNNKLIGKVDLSEAAIESTAYTWIIERMHRTQMTSNLLINNLD